MPEKRSSVQRVFLKDRKSVRVFQYYKESAKRGRRRRRRTERERKKMRKRSYYVKWWK